MQEGEAVGSSPGPSPGPSPGQPVGQEEVLLDVETTPNTQSCSRKVSAKRADIENEKEKKTLF